jgi:hypothetical protein
MKEGDIPELRERLLKRQDGICPICIKVVDAPCLDHHHVKRIKGTGQIRGVLCRACNTFIGKMENNCVRYGVKMETLPAVLRNTALYLEKPHFPYIHPSEREKPKKLKKSSYNKLKKANGGQFKFPEYPKSGKLTVGLAKLFVLNGIEPEYYK